MEKLFAIGDIHGCYNTLVKLFAKISPGKSDQIVFLGDYIDRGPKIKETVDFLIALKKDGFHTCYLLGNHELFLLNGLKNQDQLSLWFLNGGQCTLDSFRVKDLKSLEPHYVRFFKGLVYYLSIDEYLFVHAGFNDNIQNPFSDKESMLWTRSETYSSKQLSGNTIIHGHTPTTPEELAKRVNSASKVLNLDTGCIYNYWPKYGYLSAIELRSKTITSVRNCD